MRWKRGCWLWLGFSQRQLNNSAIAFPFFWLRLCRAVSRRFVWFPVFVALCREPLWFSGSRQTRLHGQKLKKRQRIYRRDAKKRREDTERNKIFQDSEGAENIGLQGTQRVTPNLFSALSALQWLRSSAAGSARRNTVPRRISICRFGTRILA